ncbi:DMT family transporter [Streptomyces sp. NPDC058676]|uniref:DMT family transporter n=1 Tax=unclassified Streptomyces TaxID=2593676 RepID=UPI003665F13A
MNLLLSVAFVLCWSSGFVGAKLGTEDAGALTILMWRFLPLALVLAAAAVTRHRASWRGLTTRDVGRQAVIGLLSQSGYLLTVYWAIQLGVSTGTTALIDGTQPLVAGALAGPLLRQYVSGRQWLGLCLGLVGVALVATADAGTSTGVAWWSYLVPFTGMLSLVAATFIEQRSRTHVTPTVSMTVHCVTSALVFTGAALAVGSAAPPSAPSFWIAIVWLVTLSTFGGYGLYWIVLRRFGVTKVNTLMFLMAPVTAVWGALMFGEPFTARTAVGLAVALSAVAVVHAASPRAAQSSRNGGSDSDGQGERRDGRRQDAPGPDVVLEHARTNVHAGRAHEEADHSGRGPEADDRSTQ